MRFRRKAYFLLIGFFYLFVNVSIAQDQRLADSLAIIYKADTVSGEAKLELLRNLTFNELNDSDLSLKYADELINLATQRNNNTYLFHGYYQKGNCYRVIGDLDEAADAYFKSAEVAKINNFKSREGNAYGAIADIYAISDNHQNAMLYYEKAISNLRQPEDSIQLASYILNAGDALLNNKNYDEALAYFIESGEIFENKNYLVGKAYNLGNIGLVYANTGKNNAAEKNIDEAIEILEQFEDYYPISVYLIAISDIYLEKGDQATGLNYIQRSLELAQQYGLKDQISDANLKLSELYEIIGNTSASLKHYKDYIAYRDSVKNIESVQSMADLRFNYEVSQKQMEVDLLNEEKKNQQIIAIASIIGMVLFILFAIGLFQRNRYIVKTKAIIEEEKDRSENLLLNILPEETAKELKEHGKVEAVKFDEVTVLFTDFVKFSSVAEKVEPEQLVKSIDFYFRKFDEIGVKYGLEKIKTIGDAYMTACGLPTPNTTHAKDVTLAAKEMIEMVNNELTNQDSQNGLCHFEIRIGIHTGPVVAGIVGTKKWQYDIWGDTVNIASRMESSSKPGMINLSETTYNKIKNDFQCEYRGELEVKNRGILKMYFLS